MNNEDEEDYTYELEEFKGSVLLFTKINERIEEIQKSLKPLQEELKNLKNEKQRIQSTICKTLKEKKATTITVTACDSVIEHNVKKSLKPMGQKKLKDKFIEFFQLGPGSLMSFNSKNAQQKGIDMYNYLYSRENREFNTKDELKVVKNAVSF